MEFGLYSLEDEHATVEAVRPACIRRRRQLVPLKQIVDVLQHQSVGVEEHTLRELCQPPTVQLRERDSQLRPTHTQTGARCQ